MQVEIRIAADRGRTEFEGVVSRPSFSFGGFYEAGNTHFGCLLAHNDDTLEPCAGYDTHPHRELEIVTWMLDGALVHDDGLTGTPSALRRGQAQRLTAGRGVQHSEHADAGSPARYLQMWLQPDEPGREPSYARADLNAALAGGALTTVASGRPEHAGTAALRLDRSDASFLVARPVAGGRCELPAARYLHVYIANGQFAFDGADPVPALVAGDSVRITDAHGLSVRQLGPIDPLGPEPEICVWQLDSGLT